MSNCRTCGIYINHWGDCDSCIRQNNLLVGLENQRIRSLRDQRELHEEQQQENEEALERLTQAQQSLASEIKKSREVDVFRDQISLAEQGNSKAQNYIGFALENGVGTETDLNNAISWYRKAEKNRELAAKENLVRIYNEKEKKAKKGDSNEQNWLGWLYENGVGTEIDLDAAIVWYTEAEKNGELAAKKNLERIYFETLKKAKNGGGNEQQRAGWLLRNGLGTEIDLDAAIDWYKKAEENGILSAKEFLKDAVNLKLAIAGDRDAQFNQGYVYDTGGGAPQDLDLAEEWYRKAANQGHGCACYNLGVLSENKNGITEEALTWYKISLKNGFEDAKKAITKINKALKEREKLAHEVAIKNLRKECYDYTHNFISTQKKELKFFSSETIWTDDWARYLFYWFPVMTGVALITFRLLNWNAAFLLPDHPTIKLFIYFIVSLIPILNFISFYAIYKLSVISGSWVPGVLVLSSAAAFTYLKFLVPHVLRIKRQIKVRYITTHEEQLYIATNNYVKKWGFEPPAARFYYMYKKEVICMHPGSNASRPMTVAELEEQVGSDKKYPLDSATLVNPEGFNYWLPANRVPELSRLFPY